MISRKGWIVALCVAATVVSAVLAARRPMDFRVYHYGVRGFFEGTRPMYGPASGLGWPMHYRYPPLFMLLFAPFAALPLAASAAVWVILKAIVLALLLYAVAKRFPAIKRSWWIPFLLATPYVVQDFHYGNVQLFIFVLTAMSLMLARDKPIPSAAALALAISLKVWPLFFVPYLLARGERTVVALTLILTILLTLAPALYFGLGGNAQLLAQWFRQEYTTQTGQDEIWFPSQSLRGVLMRYLTVIDYSQVPDSNYRQVAFVDLNPRLVRLLWVALAGSIYIAFIVWTYKRRGSDGWIESSLAFCLMALLQPFTQKYALVVLLWPAIGAIRRIGDKTARTLIYMAIALIWIQPLIPGSGAQRLIQVLGADFAATAILAAVFWKNVNSDIHMEAA